MPAKHLWNHHNFAVPPERLPRVEQSIDALFPWTKFVNKPDLLGYLLTDDMNHGAVYFRPSPAAGALHEVVERLRREHAELDEKLTDMERQDPDWNDHSGILLPSIEAWEQCVARAQRLERDRPELEIRVIDVIRPGDARAPTDYLHQAFIRIGLLGPLRNTLELQAL
jgi:hypothetical protein